MPERNWPPEENCYCGGPEEIYPHRIGTGHYCRLEPTDTPPARRTKQDGDQARNLMSDWEATEARAKQLLADADMRIQVVQREINRGALGGLGSRISEFAAALVIVALDTFDEHLKQRPPNPIPNADYGSSWTELRGYVQQAARDGDHLNPDDLLAYLDELHRRALAPVKEWMEQVRGGDTTGELRG